MRRMIRRAGFAAALVVLFVAVAVAGFRIAALLREVQAPEVAATGGKWVEAGGLKLHYSEWGNADAPALLLVHGTSAWSQTWRDIAVPLGAAGWRVIAPDLPPFGYSQRPSDGDYSRVAQAEILSDFARVIGLRDYVLIGHSFGGGATVEMAQAEQASLRGLVLLDVALGLDSAPAGLVSHLLRFRPVATVLASATFANPLVLPFGLRSFVADGDLVTADRVDLYAQPLVVAGTSSAIGDWLATGLMGDQSTLRTAGRDGLARIGLPTLVIWGKEDTVTPLAQGHDIVATLPDADLVVLDGVNHIPHIERPDAVVASIQRFLAELPPPGRRGAQAD